MQVTTTAFFTRCSPKRSNWVSCIARLCRMWLLVCLTWGAAAAVQAQASGGQGSDAAVDALPAAAVQASDPAVADSLQLRSSGDALLLSTTLRFELPALVEDALHKGIPVHFVQEARLLSERWYWSDKVVAQTARHLRLSFQPLTRRWRLYAGATSLSERGPGGVALGVSFDSLEDALSAMQRITHWNVAELAQLPSSGDLQLEVQMRIDTAQLPRPLQIGNLGRSGWNVLAARSKRFDVRELH